MPGPELPEEPLRVDIVDQIIVGFDEKLGALDLVDARARVEAALERLSRLPATVLRRFVEGSDDKQAFFAFALIRLDDPDLTLAGLQKRLADKDALLADVSWFERNAPIATDAFTDPLSSQQWALAKLGATRPWTVAPPLGSRTIVAIVDSGLRRPDGSVHADLGWVEPGGGIDRDGHGTLLAGTIGARPDNAGGVSSAVPYSWNISLLSLQFFSPSDPPNAYDAALAIAVAVLRQAKVINASWHVPPGSPGLTILRFVMNVATTRSLIVMAAGNDGTDNEVYPIYPANFGREPGFRGRVLTVLATDRYDGKAFFSNYGRNIVDLGAPGVGILTTARYLVNPPRYAEYSGTSAAAAYVSAGAALVFALNPLNWDGAGAPAWGPLDVIQHLTASANTVHDLRLACIGGRRLNLRRAVYGPLRIETPAPGATLEAGLPYNISWTLRYNNPAFTHVKIEFSTTGNPPYMLLSPPTVGWPIGSPFPWTPRDPADKTPNGCIRITPIQGNFPRRSRPFRVI